MISEPMIALDQFDFVGNGLVRPGCVLAHRTGLLFTSDWSGNGGVGAILPDGSVHRIEAKSGRQMRPNGIALEPGGTFLLAHLGERRGGVFRLHVNGRVESVLEDLDGKALPPTNFVYVDQSKRMWVTVSTRLTPRSLAYSRDVADGFIVLKDRDGARIVADELGYANECLPHPDGRRLFVSEMCGRRLTAFDIADNGDLTNRRTVCEFGEGLFADGMAFDRDGNVWIVSVVSNRVIRIDETGRQTVIAEDADADHVAWVEDAFREDQMDRPHFDAVESRMLRNISGIAFGGPDLKTAHLGCLLGDKIAAFAVDTPGYPMSHWEADLGPLPQWLARQHGALRSA